MQLLRDGECVLRVMRASRDDLGRYSCCASNVVGRDICSADVYLEGAELVDSTSYISEEAMNKINLVARSVSVCLSCLSVCLSEQDQSGTVNAVKRFIHSLLM